jgi:TetR/AcrR family transcriptional regulator, transcriptional repressor of bet genes
MQSIDHGERRQKIAGIAADVIAREGLDAATVRRIAAEAGFSTTIVTHYFANKDEVLLWAYRFVAAQAVRRFDQVVALEPGDVVGGLLSLTAVDESTRPGWRVYIAFWQKAGAEPLFADEQRLWSEHALARVGEVIRSRFGDRIDSRQAAQLLIALVQGISLQALFDPVSWSREKIRTVLSREVETLLGQGDIAAVTTRL